MTAVLAVREVSRLMSPAAGETLCNFARRVVVSGKFVLCLFFFFAPILSLSRLVVVSR